MLPTFTLNNTPVTRLIAGGNPFSGKAALSAMQKTALQCFYTDDKVIQTLKHCDECGINTVMLHADVRSAQLLDTYRQQGGTMHWIAVIGEAQLSCDTEFDRLMHNAPIAVCIDSEFTDRLFLKEQYEDLKAAIAKLKARGFCTGLATTMPEVVELTDKQSWDLDFYVCSIYNFSSVVANKTVETISTSGDELDIYRMYYAVRQTAKPCIVNKILTSWRRRARNDYVETAIREAYHNSKFNDAVVIGFDQSTMDQVAADAKYADVSMAWAETFPYHGEYDGAGTWTEHILDGIPAYWKAAVETAAQKVNCHEAESSQISSMIFVTDSHWEQNNRNTVPLIKALKQRTNLHRVVFGGDFMQGQPLLSDAARITADWVEHMNGLGEDGWYTVRGNHDNNACWGAYTSAEIWSDDDFYDHVMRYAKNARADGSKELYNYADDTQAKIRYYFLDTYSSGECPIIPESINKVPFETQVAWLRETAAQLTPDWGIVVIQHRGFTEYRAKEDVCYTEEERKLFPTLDGIGSPEYDEAGHYIGPYMGNVGFHQHGICELYGHAIIEALNEIALDPNFPEVIAVITGHTHWDASLKTDAGYYLIATTCDADATSSRCFDTLCPVRTPGTDREQLLDVVQIDRDRRRIYFTRLGPGIDREFTY